MTWLRTVWTNSDGYSLSPLEPEISLCPFLYITFPNVTDPVTSSTLIIILVTLPRCGNAVRQLEPRNIFARFYVVDGSLTIFINCWFNTNGF